jgi:hypothetical protein
MLGGGLSFLTPRPRAYLYEIPKLLRLGLLIRLAGAFPNDCEFDSGMIA